MSYFEIIIIYSAAAGGSSCREKFLTQTSQRHREQKQRRLMLCFWLYLLAEFTNFYSVSQIVKLNNTFNGRIHKFECTAGCNYRNKNTGSRVFSEHQPCNHSWWFPVKLKNSRLELDIKSWAGRSLWRVINSFLIKAAVLLYPAGRSKSL